MGVHLASEPLRLGALHANGALIYARSRIHIGKLVSRKGACMGGRISTCIFGLGLLALLSGCGPEKAEPKQRSRVFVQTVQPADFAAAVTLTGDIQARVQTDLSFRVGGKIIQRMVDVGDRVSAKQVLAKLDPKDLQSNVDSAQAQVVAEQARVKQTAAAFVRQEKLLPKGYTSRSEYDTAQAALRSNQSALAAAQAQL